MKSREGFSLEPSKEEQKIIEKMKDNPKGYVDDQVRKEVEARFEGMNANELAIYSEKGSAERLGMIKSFVSIHDFAVSKCEEVTGEKLHASFYYSTQKSELIGGVIDKVIKMKKQDEEIASDNEKIKKAKMHKGTRDHAPDTLHYGD